MVTVTFYLTREIIIISLIILIVIFKCAYFSLVAQLVPSLLNFQALMLCTNEIACVVMFEESLS